MSRMAEYAAEQQENLSGNDIFEHQHWEEQQRQILDQIEEVSAGMIAEGKAWNERMNYLRKPLAGRLPATKTQL